MAKLTVRSESGEQTSHELADETATIGRSPENSILLEDVSVSGRHAELSLVGQNWHLKDLNSTNGTLVNGQLIRDVLLRAGDRIRFGKVEVCYECAEPGTAQPLPRREEAEAQPADSSARPADFANASPFPNRKKEKDPARAAILAVAAIAILAFFGSMIAVFLMRAPIS